MKKPTPFLAVSIFPLIALPGCIAWEIRDEIRATNQHLCEVKPALVHTLHSVEETNQAIARTQAQLAEVQAALTQTQTHLASVHFSLKRTDGNLVAVGDTLGQTNPRLGDVQGELERMRILTEVNATLKDVHSTLGPLGRAMGSLGGAMSWLGMRGDASTDLLSTEAPAASPDGAGAETAGVDAQEVAGTKRPDPILGTWIMVYPLPSAAPAGSPTSSSPSPRITVVMADGRLLAVESGQRPRNGRWERSGRSLTLTLDAEAPGGQPETETAEILTLNTRTMTLRRGDDLRVHARP
ncbi:MAG: hypothetical protein ACK4WH_09095 [Phycisphaerales bacterium]